MQCLVQQACRKFPSTPALISKNRVVSYQQLHGWVDQTVQNLITAGIKPKTRLAIAAAPSLEYIVLLIACWRLRVIPCLLNTRLPQKVIQQQRQFLHCKFLITDPHAYTTIREGKHFKNLLNRGRKNVEWEESAGTKFHDKRSGPQKSNGFRAPKSGGGKRESDEVVKDDGKRYGRQSQKRGARVGGQIKAGLENQSQDRDFSQSRHNPDYFIRAIKSELVSEEMDGTQKMCRYPAPSDFPDQLEGAVCENQGAQNRQSQDIGQHLGAGVAEKRARRIGEQAGP